MIRRNAAIERRLEAELGKGEAWNPKTGRARRRLDEEATRFLKQAEAEQRELADAEAAGILD